MINQFDEKKNTIEVWTEGKTDWIHLRTAMDKLGSKLPIIFRENRESMGDDKLLKTCQSFAERENASPVVFIFDRDNPSIIKKVNDPINSYKAWGNEVYSFALPVPPHRKGFSNICIELYYTDQEIQTEDESQRRLFLTSEFHPTSGRNRADKQLSIGNKAKLKNVTSTKLTKIVDSEVYNEDDQNVALTKANFAEAIAHNDAPFSSFNASVFEPVFDVLIQILRATRPENTVYIPDLNFYFKSLSKSSDQGQLCILNNAFFQTIWMALQLFSIATIRVYEQQIMNEDKKFCKNAKDIKKILSQDFFNPTLKTLIPLSKKCFHLIDESAPEALLRMKETFETVFILEALGQMLEDMELMYPPPKGKVRYINKSTRRDDLFGYLDMVAVYEIRLSKKLHTVSTPFIQNGQIRIETWFNGLIQLSKLFGNFFSCPIIFRNVQYVDPISGKYEVENITYNGNSSFRETIPYASDELDDGSIQQSLLKLSDNFIVSLYPMLIVKDDTLFTYRRSRSAGYEYYSTLQGRIHIEQTKKKLIHSMFRTGGLQELFWTEVPPTTNPITGIRANIPHEGVEKFVGRKLHQKNIFENILEVTNENGIIYGPGGIGKTALMQIISMRLFDEPECAQHDIENIIWISAKKDFYDPNSGIIEPKEYNFTSFEDIVTAILEFNEFESLQEYSLEEKKDLVLEIFVENPTLLILDNFETIKHDAPVEADLIIDFFGKQVKRALRKYPNNYKIIITSREQIPGGFQQVALKGLDPEESDELLDKWLEWYGESLDRKQRDEIYEATKGIPIVIKHCLGQLYEFRKPFSQVLRELSDYDGEIVQFSFKEILEQIESEKDQLCLKILLLLELIKHPLKIDQIKQLLTVSMREIEKSIPKLSRFQCIETVYHNNMEKYQLNNEVRNLTRAIKQKNLNIVEDLRVKLTSSMDLSFDASNDEILAAQMLEKYIQQGDFAEAQIFADEKLSDFKTGQLFNYHYASFLLKQGNPNKAIAILKSVLQQNNNDPKVLVKLINTNKELPEPQYEQMEKYATLLKSWTKSDHDILLSVANFYSDWAIWLKSLVPPQIPHEHHLRIKKYKDIAQKGLDIVDQVPVSRRNHKELYIKSKCKHCRWEYEKALDAIQSAIEFAPTEGDRAQYFQFKSFIISAQQKYN